MHLRAYKAKESQQRSFYCGVDVGAVATKLVLIDSNKAMVARVVLPSGADYQATARTALDQAVTAAGINEPNIAFSVATGYGRHNVTFANRAITEIQGHGVGCFHQFSRSMTLVDIGGQDNKVIRLDDDGQRKSFKMNRKCAAGTGAFIEEMALRLTIPLEEMDRLARSTNETVRLSSFCTVFAKTEILSHLRQGCPVEQIVRGAFLAVVQRVVEMDVLEGDVVLTGGVVAHHPIVAEILAERLGRSVNVPPHPQFTGALGAALLARLDDIG